MRRILVRRVAGLLAAVVLLVTTACSPARQTRPIAVGYLTSFGAFGRDAYVYVALDKGFLRDAGFEVTIRPGAGTVDVMRSVADGRADFAPVDLTTAMMTISGERLPVRAVAAVQQRSMAALVTLDSSAIATPGDLAGRTIGDVAGSANQALFPLYARAGGLDPATVRWTVAEPTALPRLLASGRVDAIGQFVVGVPLVERAAGRRARALPYSTVLPDLFGNSIIAAERAVRENPERVRRFVAALLRGLDYTLAHPEESGRILARHVPSQDAGVATAEIVAMRDYARPPGFSGVLGALEPARVEATLRLLRLAGVVHSGLSTSDVVAPGVMVGP